MNIATIEKPFNDFFAIVEAQAKTAAFTDESWKEYSRTTVKHISAGLILKSNQHCKAALILIKAALLEDTVILLRSAYESTLYAGYFHLHSIEKNNYLTWSDIAELEDYIFMSDLIRDFPVEDEAKEYDRLLQEQSNKKEYILKQIELNLDIERNYIKKLNENKNPVNFQSFHEMFVKKLKLFKEKDIDQGFFHDPQIKFQAYRVASSLVHSNWVTVLRHYLMPNQNSVTLFSEHNTLLVLLGICEENMHCLYEQEFLNETAHKDLFEIYQKLKSDIIDNHPESQG